MEVIQSGYNKLYFIKKWQNIEDSVGSNLNDINNVTTFRGLNGLSYIID